MKQVIHRKLTSNILHLGLIILLTFTTSLHAQEGDPAKGKALFNTNCAACHKLDKKMTGPALRNIEQKIADDAGLDRKWITAWIHNSSGLIKSGDAYANKIFKEYNGVAMTAFPQLSDQDISDILAYTAEVPKEKPAQATDATASQQAAPSGGTSNKLILGALALLFGLLAIALVLVRQTLNRFAEAKGVAVPKDKNESLWKAFVQNQFLVIVVTIFLVLSASYFAFGYLMQVGVDQNYQPVQPIHYSHRIHAGDNGIDCKYCHSSARVSKTSGIPSLNVCMNCHKSISEVAESTATPEYSKEFYDGEIQKLYKAAGWSDADQKYTGEPQPVKWVRIHNLPDFAYFNHSQHVTVGGIECQTCHGPVETMEVVYQYSPLTMGWCINCHRTTNVKVEDNAYYTKIHEQLSKKYGVDKLTVAQMGGMECGKCHY